jgi:LPS export ABC transporter protein LptC
MFVACGENDEIKAPGAGTADADSIAIRPDQQFRDAQIFLYDKDRVTTDIKAGYIEKYDKQDSTLAWKLEVIFFDSTGARKSRLVSDSGLIREEVNIMDVYGHVRIINNDSAKLFSTHLNYNSAYNLITTDSFVVIIPGVGDTVQGYGFEADPKLGNWSLKRQVSGSMINARTFFEQ